jgi:pimeloyl-ACP methyl ester carboxylesterase
VLDGVEALSRKSWVEYRAQNMEWGLGNLAKLCAADKKCAAVYDIPALIDRALALFDKGPLAVTYTDPKDPSLTVTGEITADDFARFVYERLGSRFGAFSLPAALTEIVKGPQAAKELLGPVFGAALIASRNPAPSSIADLMHYAMVCAEDPVRSVQDVKLDGTGRLAQLFATSLAEQYASACSTMGVQELPASVHVDATTDVPVLILSGTLDIATPTFRSKEVAGALPNAALILFSGTTHVQIANINQCAAKVMKQFVAVPTAALNTACIAEAVPMSFVVPERDK